MPEEDSEAPQGGELPEWLEARMFRDRVVWLRGALDAARATLVATQLMTLDAEGDDTIRLHLNSAGGSLGAALTLMDTVGALGVAVEAVCSGRAEGPALGVLAVAHHRLAASHARLRLADEEIEVGGPSSLFATQLEQHRKEVERFVTQVARACGQPAERVEVDLAQGLYLDAEEALRYHLIDAIWPERQRGPSPPPP